MTPAQLEHLRLLKAHLETLLETAQKRTPGEWKSSINYLIGGWWVQDKLAEEREGSVADFGRKEDANFIASCAGNAEAGWKSTLAAIKAFSFEATCDSYIAQEDAEALLLAILAVWPIESLQK